MKFPYAVSNFRDLRYEDNFYCDRTDKIPLLEEGKYQLFIRPRRFGKSLLLSTLENYYDVARKDEFEGLFGDLYIGQNPTKLRNSYFILRFDFSCIEPSGSLEDIRSSLYNHINGRIRTSINYYQDHGFNIKNTQIFDADALYSLELFFSTIRSLGYPLFLFIDEYDNFANTVMMNIYAEKDKYKALVHDEGILRTFFKFIKASTSNSLIDRIFMTGVSPIVMSDITSGYNIAENISYKKNLNNLCGFTEEEVRKVIQKITADCDLSSDTVDEAMMMIKTYYNGHRFFRKNVQDIYNPTLCIYFFKIFQEECEYPAQMLDRNMATDDSKLEFIAGLPNGRDMVFELSQTGSEVLVPEISEGFGLQEMLRSESKDRTFIASFLYYFGVLTLLGETEDLQLRLRVPNLVMQSLYIKRIQRMFLPEPDIRDQGKETARMVYTEGKIASLCQFIQEKLFPVLKNRDYRWANELILKTAFLSLLYNNILYIMDSEPEVERKYADLTMIIRPDKRYGKLYDVLIEFKFVQLKQLGLSGDKVRSMAEDDLYSLPLVQQALKNGQEQVRDYGARLENKYGNLRLKKFVVVGVGFERIVCWA